MAKLLDVLFQPYLKSDFLSKQYMYAKLLHKRRMALFTSLQRLRRLIHSSGLYATIFSKCECLQEIIFAANLLRFRVDDYVIFEICQRELLAIQKISVKGLESLANAVFNKNTLISMEELVEKIHSLESLYEHTLQVVTRDPLVFLFFIQDFYVLGQEIENTGKLINEIHSRK